MVWIAYCEIGQKSPSGSFGGAQQPIPPVIRSSRLRRRQVPGHNKNQRAPEPLWAALAPYMYQPSSAESPVKRQNRLPRSVPT